VTLFSISPRHVAAVIIIITNRNRGIEMKTDTAAQTAPVDLNARRAKKAVAH